MRGLCLPLLFWGYLQQYSNNMQDIIDKIVAVQKVKFPERTVEGMITHLKEEVFELYSSILAKENHEVCMEFADCFILLFGAAALYGLEADEIKTFIKLKLKVVEGREYGPVNELGYRKHIEK